MIDITRINFSELERLLAGDVSDKIAFYEQSNAGRSIYSLTLSNGEKISLKFPSFSVPHLLGFKQEGLNKLYGKKINGDVFEQLKYACDDYYRIYSECISSKRTPITDIVSKHIQEKINAFSENIRVNIYNMDFICKYDKNQAYKLGKDALPYDYIICKHNSIGEYFVLGLVEDFRTANSGYYINNNVLYYPKTSQYFANYDELINKYSEYLENQSLSYVSALYISGWKGFTMQSNVKLEHTKTLKEIASSMNAYVDVTGEYEFCLNKHKENLDSGMLLTKDYSDIVADAMIHKEIIIPERFGLTDFSTLNIGLVKIINAYNDSLINNPEISVQAHKSYSEMSSKVDELDDECKRLQECNERLNAEVSKLTNEGNNLFVRNQALENSFKIIDSEVQKVLRK